MTRTLCFLSEYVVCPPPNPDLHVSHPPKRPHLGGKYFCTGCAEVFSPHVRPPGGGRGGGWWVAPCRRCGPQCRRSCRSFSGGCGVRPPKLGEWGVAPPPILPPLRSGLQIWAIPSEGFAEGCTIVHLPLPPAPRLVRRRPCVGPCRYEHIHCVKEHTTH